MKSRGGPEYTGRAKHDACSVLSWSMSARKEGPHYFSDAWSSHDNTVSKVQSIFPVDKMLSSPLTTSGKLTRLWFYSKYTLTCLVTKYMFLKIFLGLYFPIHKIGMLVKSWL